MKLHISIIHVLMIGVLSVLCSCAGGGNRPDVDTRNLVVSIEPQRYLLEQIAGPQWSVTTVLPGGDDPESFDPPISVLRNIADADMYFMVGTLPFEQQLQSKLSANVSVCNTSRGIDLLHGTHQVCDGSHDGCRNEDTSHHHHDDAGGDPHVWTSLRNAVVMSDNMLSAMCSLDPDSAVHYRERHAQLVKHIQRTDSLMEAMLKYDAASKSFVVRHPSLSYFARDYGLQQIPVGFENRELTAQGVARASRAVQSAPKGTIAVTQPQFDNTQASTIASGLPTVQTDAMSYDFIDQLKRLACALANEQ